MPCPWEPQGNVASLPCRAQAIGEGPSLRGSSVSLRLLVVCKDICLEGPRITAGLYNTPRKLLLWDSNPG